jgi:hypothetical protein
MVIMGVHQAQGFRQRTWEKKVSATAAAPAGSRRDHSADAAASATASGGHR